MIEKWITYVISTENIRILKEAEKKELTAMLENSIKDLLMDFEEGIPTTFKITNLPRSRK